MSDVVILKILYSCQILMVGQLAYLGKVYIFRSSTFI